jgi:DNA-binding transcriptional ArsR family regulator
MALADTAALLADHTRAAFCLALLDGRAWTVTELAHHAGVAVPTASEHISRLTAGGLLAEERQGRHRYVRLAGVEAASLIEDLASFPTASASERGPATLNAPTSPTPATPAKPRTLRDSNRHAAEARARTCYDHLAGRLGVAVADSLLARGVVTDSGGLAMTDAGRAWLADTASITLPEPTRRGSRPLIRPCLDWTERRTHLGGVVGAEICRTALERGWVERFGSGRALKVTEPGRRAFRTFFGVDVDA